MTLGRGAAGRRTGVVEGQGLCHAGICVKGGLTGIVCLLCRQLYSLTVIRARVKWSEDKVHPDPFF